MSSESTDGAPNTQSMPQDDHQTVGDCCGRVLLRCPVRGAYPHLVPDNKTCDNHCNGIRRVKDHLNKRHQCTCPGQPEPCQNPLHLGPKKLKELKAIRLSLGETPGEQWGRIFKTLYPDRNGVPAPYVPSAGHLKAIAGAPPPGFAEQLAESLQDATHGSIDEVHLLLAKVPHFIDLVCRTGAYPDSLSTAHQSSNNTTVSLAHTSKQGSDVAEHQQSMDDDSDLEAYLNLAHATY